MPTIRVVTEDGVEFVGHTDTAVVRKMRDTQWNAPERKRQWMDEVSDRLRRSHGANVPYGATAEEFLAALEVAGVVTVTRA